MASQPVQTESSTGDKLKITLAVIVVLAGICGFYVLAGKPTLTRIGVLIVGLIVGAALVWFSASGRNFLSFAKESVRETKKVVWPERNDALRITVIVFGFVLLMAVFLWGSDRVLDFVLYNLILGWKR